MSELPRRRRRARGLAGGRLGAARAVPRRPRHDAHGVRSAARARSLPTTAASPGTCRATARRRCRPSGSRSRCWPMPSPTLIEHARRDASAHLAGLSMGGQVALHAALRHPARVRSLALLDSSPAFGLDGTDPEAWKRLRLDRARRRRDAREHRRAGAPLDHGARRRRRRGRRRRRVDVAHLGRRPARGGRVPALARRARAARRDRACRRWCSSASSTSETPLAYAEALAAGIPGARLQIIPGAGHISNLEAPDAVNAALRAHLDGVEGRRHDRVALARRLRPPAARVRAQRRRGRRRALGVGQPARSSSRRAASPRRCWAVASTTSSCRRRANRGPVALRSTGASVALAGNRGAIAALAAADLVIDCTVEGLLHAPELRRDPARRRARADDQQRAPRELRALRRRLRRSASASSTASRCSRRPARCG